MKTQPKTPKETGHELQDLRDQRDKTARAWLEMTERKLHAVARKLYREWKVLEAAIRKKEKEDEEADSVGNSVGRQVGQQGQDSV